MESIFTYWYFYMRITQLSCDVIRTMFVIISLWWCMLGNNPYYVAAGNLRYYYGEIP